MVDGAACNERWGEAALQLCVGAAPGLLGAVVRRGAELQLASGTGRLGAMARGASTEVIR